MAEAVGPRTAVALTVALILAGAGCASSASVGVRPSPFPNVPAPRWAFEPDAGYTTYLRDVLATALSLRGTRYQFGGTSPQGGFDCSGFVRYVFGLSQVDLPRTVAEQFNLGRAVADSHLSRGDLLFFSTTGPGATHVGIVVDPVEQTFVHAPGTGSVVRTERFDTPYWSRRRVGVRRLALVPQEAASRDNGS